MILGAYALLLENPRADARGDRRGHGRPPLPLRRARRIVDAIEGVGAMREARDEPPRRAS